MNTKLKLLTVIIFALFALAIFTPRGEMQTQTVTAGQKFKNIKVLNDMPADQMGKVMNQVSASLGVNCAFCHTVDQWEKDDKPEKNTAREMFTMTFALNKEHFNNRPEISCNTCHSGKTHPQAAPNLAPKVGDERPKQPEVKPTVDDILAKYLTAIGGKTKLDKVTSRMIKANRVETDGTTETEEIWQKSNKMLVATNYVSKERGNFTTTEAFNGTDAWKKGARGEIPLKPDEVENIRRNAELFANADIKTVYKTLELGFFDKIDGREVWSIRATTTGGQRERLFFDNQTGLLVRRSTGVPTILGFYTYQVDYTDYKDFGGVKLPMTIRFAAPNLSWKRQILEVKNNVAVDDAKFNK